MRKLVIAGAVIATLAAAQSAAAQERLRANERYCLETADGGEGGGGSGPLLCRYETLAQCMASRTGQSDRCTLNPALGAQPIR
jgi:hypothetical protein